MGCLSCHSTVTVAHSRELPAAIWMDVCVQPQAVSAPVKLADPKVPISQQNIKRTLYNDEI